MSLEFHDFQKSLDCLRLQVGGSNLLSTMELLERMFAASSELEGDRDNCNLGIRNFLRQAQLEGDRATTAIWELEIFGGRPSWKATGQPGNSRFLGAGPNSRFFGGRRREVSFFVCKLLEYKFRAVRPSVS